MVDGLLAVITVLPALSTMTLVLPPVVTDVGTAKPTPPNVPSREPVPNTRSRPGTVDPEESHPVGSTLIKAPLESSARPSKPPMFDEPDIKGDVCTKPVP